jgi:hypothetical protein
MIRQIGLASILTMLVGSAMAANEASLGLPKVTVGKRLETSAMVKLGEAAPEQGVQITLRSSNPTRLLISKAPEEAGAASITLRAREGARLSPEFWLQGLDSSGEVTYEAEAQGYAKASGIVTLSASGIAIVGPFKAPKFFTTSGALPTNLTLYSVRLDSALKYAEEQLLAGGAAIKVEVTSSNGVVGKATASPLELGGGTSHATAYFQPAGEGETMLGVKQPAGFQTPADFASVTVSIRKPGCAISTELYVGQNLQVSGVLALGEPAPADGLQVTLTSDDPKRLLLSLSDKEEGSKSITIKIPSRELAARYYIQALGNEGPVTYSANAPGYQSRTGTIWLAPSGVIVTPIWQGPPDEGQVLRPGTPDSKYQFLMSLTQAEGLKLVVWTAQLDPKTHRSADITVQPLRPGLTLTVPLTSSDPTVGKTVTEVTIKGGIDHSTVDFVPIKEGSTEISVTTPAGFTRSANSTSVVGMIRK